MNSSVVSQPLTFLCFVTATTTTVLLTTSNKIWLLQWTRRRRRRREDRGEPCSSSSCRWYTSPCGLCLPGNASKRSRTTGGGMGRRWRRRHWVAADQLRWLRSVCFVQNKFSLVVNKANVWQLMYSRMSQRHRIEFKTHPVSLHILLPTLLVFAQLYWTSWIPLS